ncbi:TPA: 30S ribosomal protein S20 [Patescibacteria group bacterium]|nr:MAG: 30S ribosomal protein S20 [Parcubacteria group bacterium GW2011_GWA2_46_39]HBV33597.1 30S ribosomal protein S20 [Patescibacteria group bacterium]HCU48185.1 30S ribosomal protein S20 [Patescibacteria group bacterium]
MPIKAASFKHLRQTKVRTLRNHKVLSTMTKVVKAARRAITAKAADAKDKLKLAIKTLDSAAQKGIIKPNTAARLKSRLSKALNKSLK